MYSDKLSVSSDDARYFFSGESLVGKNIYKMGQV